MGTATVETAFTKRDQYYFFGLLGTVLVAAAIAVMMLKKG